MPVHCAFIDAFSISLPYEMLVNVARYLGPGDLHRWMHIHPAFYQASLERRYHNLSLAPSYLELFLQIENMRQDAMAISLVCSLKVEPDKIWDALKLKQVQGSNTRYTSFSSTGPVHYRTPIRLRGGPEVTVPPSKHPLTSEVLHDSLVSFAKGLKNVQELAVSWEALYGSTRKDHPCCPLLSTFLPLFGSNLRFLSLSLPMSVATVYIPPPDALSRLEELQIDLFRDMHTYGTAEPSKLSVLLPLINGVSQALVSLWISSPGVGNPSSPFFRGLGKFPRLEKFCLRNPLSYYGLPYGLVLRLSNSDDGSRCQRFVFLDRAAPPKPCPMWGSNWCHFRVFTTEGLHGYEADRAISSNSSSVHDGDMPSVKDLCYEALSLTVSEPSLELFEVKRLLPYFPSLNRLTLTVKNLSPQLIDLIVEGCRNLTNLRLEIRKSFQHTSDVNDILYEETRFRFELRGRRDQPRYRSWGLRDLEIWISGPGPKDRKCLWSAIRAIAYSVPAVNSCGGTRMDKSSSPITNNDE